MLGCGFGREEGMVERKRLGGRVEWERYTICCELLDEGRLLDICFGRHCDCVGRSFCELNGGGVM